MSKKIEIHVTMVSGKEKVYKGAEAAVLKEKIMCLSSFKGVIRYEWKNKIRVLNCTKILFIEEE